MKTLKSVKSAPGKYDRIGDQKGPLNLGGARAKMSENPDFVYVPHHHVAGSRKEVTKWLKEHHPSDNVKEVLSASYSEDTLADEDTLEAFEQEILLAQKDREQARDHRDQLRKMNLDFLTTFILTYEEEQRSRPKNERDGNAHSKAASTLKDKVKSLGDESRVLDVTSMKKSGKDAKKFPDKEGGNKKRLAQSSGIPFYNVVYNPSNKSSADGVRNFLKLYGGFETEKISAIVDKVKAGVDINIGQAKSPTRASLLTPTRRRGRNKRNVDEDLLAE